MLERDFLITAGHAHKEQEISDGVVSPSLNATAKTSSNAGKFVEEGAQRGIVLSFG